MVTSLICFQEPKVCIFQRQFSIMIKQYNIVYQETYRLDKDTLLKIMEET